MLRRQAFTLIELIVVIALIAILAAILFPVFGQSRAKARSNTCLSNTRQLGTAALLYNQDYDETFPQVMFWDGKEASYYSASYLWSSSRCIGAYVRNSGAFLCPADRFKPIETATIYKAGFPSNIPLVSNSYIVNALSPILSCDTFDVEYPRGLFVAGPGNQDPSPPTTMADIPAPADIVMLIDGRLESYDAIFHCGAFLNNEIDWCRGDFGDVVYDWMLPLLLYSTPDQPWYSAWRKHQGSANAVFADGHCRAVRVGELDQAKRWVVNLEDQGKQDATE